MNSIEQTQEALETLFPAPEIAAEPDQEAEAGEGEADKEVEPERLPGVLVTDFAKHGSGLDVLCEADQVVRIAEILDEGQFVLESVSGVDWHKEEKLEVVYDYTRFDQENCRVTVRTFIPRENPVVPTVSGVIPGANWHERETFDFYGITFEGHPDLTRILLPEDADFHPLLKDYMP